MIRTRFTRLFRLSPVLLIAVALWYQSFPLQAQTAQLPRTASLNLCTDQLLLALADADHILALSPLARDPSLSMLSENARPFATVYPRSESLLQIKPDLVLTAPYEHRLTRKILNQNRIDTMAFGAWTGIDHGKEQIRQLAARLGHPDRGQMLINHIDEALAVRPKTALQTISFLEIERRLYAPGAQGVISDILSQWGLSNAAKSLGVERGGFVALERLIMNPPDLLIVTETSPKAEDLGTALLRHPALNRIYNDKRRIGVPTRLTLCGGPATPALIRHLREALDSRH